MERIGSGRMNLSGVNKWGYALPRSWGPKFDAGQMH
jgi:hypothetical protein